MATFTWLSGNGGIWGYQDSNLFDVTSMGLTSLTGQYNFNDGPYDPNSHAWSYEATLSNASIHTIQSGPNAGQQVYNGGKLTGINFYDNSHNLLISITGLKVDLAAFTTLASLGVYMWDMLSAGGHTFIGSANSFSSGWDGDDITTGSGNDTVDAGAGDDFISDRGGADVYIGGAGTGDTLTYDGWQWYAGQVKSGIVADMTKGTVKGPDGFIDTISGIEQIRGTYLKDTFIGDANSNRFIGFQGKDVFDGGAGSDWAMYHRDASRGGTDGIIANLTAGTIRDGFGQIDTIVSIEKVRGTDVADIFYDNSKKNKFEGLDGDDIFKFSGDSKSDYVVGGAGADRFEFLAGGFGHDTIEDFSKSDGDLIVIQGPTAMNQLGITQIGNDAVITYGANSITLLDFTAGTLTAGDFVFI